MKVIITGYKFDIPNLASKEDEKEDEMVNRFCEFAKSLGLKQIRIDDYNDYWEVEFDSKNK